MSGISPTQRSKKYLEEQGYLVAIVEHWNQHARIRQDLYGFIDLLALRRDETLAVQTTTGDHGAERVRKIAESPLVGRVREAGWAIHVHCWRRLKSSNKWEVRIVDVS